MPVSTGFRRILLSGGFTAMTVLGACVESTPTGSANDELAVRASAGPATADVVLPNGGGGTFNSPITANESGWTTTEFWDNPSDDLGHCNVGYYALGTIDSLCANQAQSPTSYANRGGYSGGSFWGLPMGGGHVNPAAFMFSGSYAYLLTLKGSYAGETRKLGWFTIDSTGTRIRHEVASWGAKNINSTVLIPRGVRWGLYIENNDTTTAIDYSDATGDIHDPGTEPVQQFALFAKSDASAYLVGIEDNPEDGTIAVGDDDFNDYLISVEPVGAMFVIGDVEAHGIGATVNFWGAQWWKNNAMSGTVSSGVAAFKGYAPNADFTCGGTWNTGPGNSPNPPSMIPGRVLVIVTSTVLKSGSDISGNIRELLIVDQDGGYSPSPGGRGNGPVTEILCSSTSARR